MNKLAVVALCALMTGCFGNNIKAPDPYPNDADLQGCDYPMRTSDSDAALGDAYLRALSELEKCNGRLEGVRNAKSRYEDLLDDQ
ncbi:MULTISPECIES: hypothetical protein [Gammaproteobacteria]|uniref:hypothetical protein n=1 Tax=Gammaproteobacteria TaxID=1236 RepID=UPI0023594C00|nr:hypothetical protein [Pseudoalteromonas sp. GABNS16G]MDC9603233.1 hypothetical protein [Pseudoalteromonas sp. GABNS16G]